MVQYMSRVITQRGIETRSRIVETAARLFHLHSVGSTSVDQILAESETGKSQFYHYFASKQKLVHAVLSYWDEQVMQLFDAVLEDKHGAAAISALFSAVAGHQHSRDYTGGCPIASLALEVGEDDPLVQLGLELHYKRVLLAIARKLAEATDCHWNTAELHHRALGIQVALNGAILVATATKDGAAFEAGRRSSLALLAGLS